MGFRLYVNDIGDYVVENYLHTLTNTLNHYNTFVILVY